MHAQQTSEAGNDLDADGLVVSHGLLDRLAERRSALARLRRRRRLMVAGTIAVIAILVGGVGFSPALALRSDQITVIGSDGTVSQEQVRDALVGQVGTSLVWLDLGQVSQEVTDSLVRVRSARAVRQWPRGLRVSLSMRVPVASRQVAGGFEVLDADAVVLATEPEAPEGLVRVQAPGDEAAQADASALAGDGADPAQDGGAQGGQAGAASALTPTQVAAVTGVIGALDPDTRAQVVSGSATTAGYVTLRLSSGASVVWGDTRQGELKAMVLRVLLANQAQTYDVSSPRSPTTS